jgi:hypothetical protein
MENNRITFQLTGKDEDNGDLQFDEFIKQLGLVKKALNEVERVTTDSRNNTVYYKVVNLTHSSPAAIELEAVPVKKSDKESGSQINYAPIVVRNFFEGIKTIQTSKHYPSNFDYAALQAIREMTGLLGNSVTQITVKAEETLLTIDNNLPKYIDEIVGPDLLEAGSITGMLDQINIHNQQNSFFLYPTDGGRVRCLFPKSLKKDIINGIGKYVEVTGELKYKQVNLDIPFEIRVEGFEVLSDPNEGNIPKLGDLWGIAPNILEGKSVEQFVWEIRNEWE